MVYRVRVYRVFRVFRVSRVCLGGIGLVCL